jgi:hypothetical protein
MIYEGEFLDGLYENKGLLFIPETEEFDEKTGKFKTLLNKYEGTFKGGKYHGKGTLTQWNGEIIYQGEWVEGKKEGKGTLYENGKPKIEGTFKNDKLEGDAIFHYERKKYNCSYKEGAIFNGFSIKSLDAEHIFVGEFKDGSISKGKKINKFKNVLIYEGDWLFGKENGVGKYYIEGKLSYEGEFQDGDFHGKGTYLSKKGKKMEGTYANGNCKNGEGCKMNADNHVHYEGGFQDGLYHGFGIEYDDDKVEFEGEFAEGRRTGKGKIYSNGVLSYDGYLKLDVYDGTGVLYYSSFESGLFISNKKHYEGEFREGIYDGKGKLYNLEGKEFEGVYRSGKIF